MNEVLGVLALPGRRHLLPGFTTFLPAADRPTYFQLIRYSYGDLDISSMPLSTI